ncbi:MAG TPA: TorF family putative porin [Rhizomicrobium sp.]
MRGAAIAAACVAMGAAAAHAADAGDLSASIAAVSDYRFRGISQSALNPAIQPTLQWTQASTGLFVGAAGSNVNFKDPQNATVELDLFGGKEFDLDAGELSMEAYYYSFPDHHPLPGGETYSWFETIAQFSHSFGRLGVSVTGAWSPNFYEQNGTGFYAAGTAQYAVTDWLTLSGTLGRQSATRLNGDATGFPYAHWDAGATARYGNFLLDLRYSDTNISRDQCEALNEDAGVHWCGVTVIVTLTYDVGEWPL